MSNVNRKPLSRTVTRIREGLTALLAVVVSTAVLAQQAPPGGTSSVAGTLDPVTVTAERRTENIKDVPSSISTISGEKLDVLNSSGEDIRMLSGRVPSLNIESSFGRAFPRFYIRGYGNTDFHLNASQPVSLILDDVVQENPILKGFPLFDVDQVEVLSGPQGTLFGRNTPAGVVKIDSAKPTGKFEGYFNASAARFMTTNFEGAINVPLNDVVSARLSLQSQHRNDFVSNTVTTSPSSKLEGYDDNAARLQVLIQPNSDFSALVNVHARDLNGTARLFRANIIQKGTNDFVNNFDPRQVSFDGTNKQTLDSNGASVRLRWNLGAVALNSISGYEHVGAFSRGDVDGGFGAVFAPPSGPGLIPFPSETSDALHGHEQLTQEFRLESTGAGPLKYQGGVYFFHESYTIDSISYDTLFHGPNTSVQAAQANNAAAVFASANYQLTNELNLRAGIRFTKDKKFLATSTRDTVVDTSGGLSRGTSDSKFNYDVSATYAVTPDVNVYGRVATGFRGSSIFPASAFGPLTSAPAETNTSYEVGVKADLLDKKARVSLSIFDFHVKNQQLSAVGGASNSTLLLSAAKSVGHGFEGTLDAYLTERLLVTLNGSYNFTKIKDPNLRVAVCAQCTPTDPTVVLPTVPFPTTVAFINGNPLPQAPKYIGNVTARYGFPLPNGAEAFVYTDWSYRSKVNFFLYESPEFTGKSLLLGGLRAGYNWANGKYEVAAFGRNITNQVKIVGGIDFNNLTGFINEPRIWGAQFKALF
jgi:iron complex outermembrane receptor protein